MPSDELLPTLKALANANRLKIIGLLAQGERCVEELAALLGVQPPTISHHLSRLAEVGLVRARALGYYNYYRLETSPIQTLAERLLAVDSLDELASAVDRSGYPRKLSPDLVDSSGRWKTLPTEDRKRTRALEFLIRSFEPGRRYQERELDEILGRFHADPQSLRRELVEQGWMTQQKAVYWRSDLSAKGF
jgi:DNA-binding HxlR family transcriptional regulator